MTLPLPPGFPRTFGPYLLLGPLAQGGMGEVFIASTKAISGAVRLVVIKTLRPDLAKEPGYVNRFLDEARIVIQLQHTNICQVFDVGVHEGVHFFAMEHIAGTNLRRLLDASLGMLPTPLALLILAEALEGLDAAHRHRHALTGDPLRIVHRDVSPHNIMLSFEGEVKLIDFGLASSEMKMEHTGSQVVLGKIAYMSPEQARGESVDARSDQFSAAIVLYELLCGERYYGERTQREIWQVAGSRTVPSKLGQIDPELAAILGRALAFEPDARFETCGDFAAALRTVLKMRFPFAERATLKSFVKETMADDRKETEETLRVFGQAALAAMPDASHSVSTSPTTASVELRAVSKGWQPAAIAAIGGLALGALGVFVALSLAQAAPKTEAAAAPPPPTGVTTTTPAVTTTSAPPPAVAPDPPALAIAPDAPMRAVEPPAPPPASPPVRVAALPKKAAPVHSEPKWAHWPLDRKLDHLEKCTQTCAKTLRRLRTTDPSSIEPAAVDVCMPQCS